MEWAATSSSGGLPDPGIGLVSLVLAGGFFFFFLTTESHEYLKIITHMNKSTHQKELQDLTASNNLFFKIFWIR